jgi:serine phosphatase RsbU (regulator of sigma subunit)
MPIGILREVDIKKFELNLSRGDVVVMVSDGVTGESGECPWLFDLLVQNLPSRGLERTADLIVKYASARGSVDDISVVLVRIE